MQCSRASDILHAGVATHSASSEVSGAPVTTRLPFGVLCTSKSFTLWPRLSRRSLKFRTRERGCSSKADRSGKRNTTRGRCCGPCVGVVVLFAMGCFVIRAAAAYDAAGVFVVVVGRARRRRHARGNGLDLSGQCGKARVDFPEFSGLCCGGFLHETAGFGKQVPPFVHVTLFSLS